MNKALMKKEGGGLSAAGRLTHGEYAARSLDHDSVIRRFAEKEERHCVNCGLLKGPTLHSSPA